jgi:hypothetical protein
MAYLQSNTLETIAYDENGRLLRAKFRENGRTIVFEDVPQEVYDSLIFSDSTESFFEENIAHRYPVRSLTSGNDN